MSCFSILWQDSPEFHTRPTAAKKGGDTLGVVFALPFAPLLALFAPLGLLVMLITEPEAAMEEVPGIWNVWSAVLTALQNFWHGLF